jgi:P2-related tail formation protein
MRVRVSSEFLTFVYWVPSRILMDLAVEDSVDTWDGVGVDRAASRNARHDELMLDFLGCIDAQVI